MGLLKGSNIFISHFDFSLLVIFFFAICLSLGLPYITFVSNDDDADIGSAMFFNFLEPAIDIYKRVFICEVEYDKNSVGALVIGFGDGSVSLLASSIPDLQPHRTLVYLKCSESEVHSDSCNVILLEVIIL